MTKLNFLRYSSLIFLALTLLSAYIGSSLHSTSLAELAYLFLIAAVIFSIIQLISGQGRVQGLISLVLSALIILYVMYLSGSI